MVEPINPISVRYNYYALMISILCDCLPEAAFAKMKNSHPSRIRTILTDADLEDANKLREQGLLWREIAEIYNINPSNLRKKLKDYTEMKG